jgi:hypothetical protein
MGDIVFQIWFSHDFKAVTAIETNQVSLSIYTDSCVTVETICYFYTFLH